MTLREELLMLWGGGLGQKREKKLNGYSRRKKKLNSTTRKKKKLNSTTWKKKNSTQQPGRKKNHHGLYAGLRCPEHETVHLCFNSVVDFHV